MESFLLVYSIGAIVSGILEIAFYKQIAKFHFEFYESRLSKLKMSKVLLDLASKSRLISRFILQTEKEFRIWRLVVGVITLTIGIFLTLMITLIGIG